MSENESMRAYERLAARPLPTGRRVFLEVLCAEHGLPMAEPVEWQGSGRAHQVILERDGLPAEIRLTTDFAPRPADLAAGGAPEPPYLAKLPIDGSPHRAGDAIVVVAKVEAAP